MAGLVGTQEDTMSEEYHASDRHGCHCKSYTGHYYSTFQALHNKLHPPILLLHHPLRSKVEQTNSPIPLLEPSPSQIQLKGAISNNKFFNTYNDKQNRVLLVIVFIQKAIAYSCVNKIQICKHESCSIQRIEPCEKKIQLKINQCLVVNGFQS
jgi:hypothetical protein